MVIIDIAGLLLAWLTAMLPLLVPRAPRAIMIKVCIQESIHFSAQDML